MSSNTSRSQSKAAAASVAASKGAKEQLRSSSRPSTSSITSIAPSNSLFQNDYRLPSADEVDDNLGSSYDSTFNNRSCTGEVEDHKEKTATSSTLLLEPIPGSDNDKRVKIRQKNERKHQRQRERRAQELHERCTSFLISRKLEVLSHKLVAMGFSLERARLALLVNEGRVEDSVAWLFEGDDESKQQQAAAEVDADSMKIDIADELARVSEMETQFKCSKQEVERAVVACEGDLNMAAETLMDQKQQISAKVIEAADTDSNNTEKKLGLSASDGTGISQLDGPAPTASVQIQQKHAGWSSSYTRAEVVGIPQQTFMAERALHGLQSLRIQQSGPESTISPDVFPLPLEMRQVSTSSSLPVLTTPPLSVPASTMRLEAQIATAKSENRVISQPGILREPAILMQHPKSVSAKQNHTLMALNGFTSSSPPASSTGRYPNSMSDVDVMRSMNVSIQCNSPGLAYSDSVPHFQRSRYQPTGVMESNGVGRVSVGGSLTGAPSSSSSLSAPSSLGLFSNPDYRGSQSLSTIHWSTGGSSSHIDYSSIDWSLNSTSLRKDLIPESLPPTSIDMGTARPSIGSRVNNNMLASASSIGYEMASHFEEKDLDPSQFASNYKMK